MSIGVENIIRNCLSENQGETAIPYSLYDVYEDIRALYPVRESYNRYVRKIRTRMSVFGNPSTQVVPTGAPKAGKATFTEGLEGAVAESTSTRISTLEGLLDSCKVDMETWYVASHTVNTWEQNSVENGITTLYQVKANLARIKPRIPVLQPILLPHITRKLPPPFIKTNKSLIIGDAQIGFNRLKNGTWETFHDRRAMDIVLRVLEDHSFDNIIINGDMLDMTEASRYVQKPEFSGTLQPAINELGIYLEHIRRLAPTSNIVYTDANHEVRLENQMIENMKYAYGLTAYKQDQPLMSIPNILRLDLMDIEFIKGYPKGSFWIGDNLRVLHGEFTNVAKELNTSNTHVVCGHLHRVETQMKSIFFKEKIHQVSAHSHGCLCKVDGTVPGVTSRPNWQQGFVVVDHVDNHVAINHILIQEGVCLYQGKKYVGVDEKAGGVY